MLRHVLLGFDGSAPARKALKFAHDLVLQTHAKLTVLFVLEFPRVVPVAPLDGYFVAAPSHDPKDVEVARKMLEEAVADLPPSEVLQQVTVGASVADVVCQEGARLEVDLIVVGARGRSPGGRWLLGSVSDRIVHHAGRPVAVIH